MCLLELYLRLSDGFKGYRVVGLVIRWSLYLTFVGVVLATLLECRPLNLYVFAIVFGSTGRNANMILRAWNGDPAGSTYCLVLGRRTSNIFWGGVQENLGGCKKDKQANNP